MTESSAGKIAKRIAELVVLPVLVGLVVYYVAEPYLHSRLAGATGVIVAEVTAHWTVVGSTTLLYSAANYLSRKAGLAFLVFAAGSWWILESGLSHLGCTPPYVALGSLALAPVIGFCLVPTLSVMQRKNSVGGEEDDTADADYSAYGIGGALEGLARLYGCFMAVAFWLITSCYSAIVVYYVLNRGLRLSTGVSLLASLSPFLIIGIFPLFVIAAILRSAESASVAE